MAGLALGGSAIGQMTFPGVNGGQPVGAAAPLPNAYPEGNSTITQAAYGMSGGGAGVSNPGMHCAMAGLVSAGLLFLLWWSLPR